MIEGKTVQKDELLIPKQLIVGKLTGKSNPADTTTDNTANAEHRNHTSKRNDVTWNISKRTEPSLAK